MRVHHPALGVILECRFPSAPGVDNAEYGSDEGDERENEKAS
jgi:hypothetical protein